MQVLSISANGFQVLVPVNMVAQIVGRTVVAPLTTESSIPASMGIIKWREFSVPLFDTTRLHRNQITDDEYERIVVIWPLKSAGERGFMAFTSLGPPRVIEITEENSPSTDSDFELTSGIVQIGDDICLIPDLQSISDQHFGTAVTVSSNQ